jgi:hypothetical protein
MFTVNNDFDIKSLSAFVVKQIGKEGHRDGQRVVQWGSFCQAKHVCVCTCEEGKDLIEQDAEDRGFRAIHFLVKPIEQFLADLWRC